MKKRRFFLFTLYFILAVATFFVSNPVLKTVFLSIILYSATFAKDVNQFLVYMSIGVVLHIGGSPIWVLVASLPLYVSLSSYRSAIKRLIPLGVVMILALLSYHFGVESQFSTMAVYFSSLLVFVQVLDSRVSEEDLFSYAVLTAMIIVVILLLCSLRGELTLRYGRLAINGNIRELANVISVPVFLSWSMLIMRKKKKFLYIIVGVVSSFVLLLTISKGAIVAIIVSLLLVYLLTSRRSPINTSLILLIVIPILYFVFQYASGLEDFHFERLEEDFNGFSGRTDIWAYYFDSFFENNQTILFGFGPGDLKRLSIFDMYAHSLFLDMLFCYGFLMAFVWVVVFVYIARIVFKFKNPLAIGLFVFTILLYSTHGVVTDPMFFVLLATSYSLSVNRVWAYVKGTKA